jgi:hypothetical protein
MRSKRSISAWGGLGIVIFIVIWFLPWRFATNDDVIMMWLVSGAYTGTPEPYAVFIHPFLSWTLSNLYSFFPLVQWYSITFFCTLYLSFLGIVICVINRSISTKWQNVILFSVLVLWMHFSFFLQFTIVAGVAGFAGLLVFEKSIFSSSKAHSIVALILIFLSILIRWESFALFAIGFGSYQLVFKFKQFFGRKLIKYSSIAFVFCGLFFADYLYTSNSSYAEFKKYTKARAAVFDHPVFYTLGVEHQLNSNTDWFFFSQSMMDENNIDEKRLIDLKHQLDDKLYSFQQIGRSFVRLKEVMVFQNFKIAFSLLIILFYFWVFWKKPNKFLFFLAWIGFMVVFNHFFIVNFRVYILFFLPLLFPIILDADIPDTKPLIIFLIYLLIGSFLLIHLTNIFLEVKRRNSISKEFDESIRGLKNNQLIVFEGFQQHFLPIHYNSINPVPYISMGWISKSPFQTKALGRFGIEKLSGSSDFYLLGLDIIDDYYFQEYMKWLGYTYELESISTGDELILFHYTLKK